MKDIKLSDVLDNKVKETFFSTSKHKDLRELELTELELAEMAKEGQGLSDAELLRKAVRMFSLRTVSIAASSDNGKTQGVRGGADGRIEEAFNSLIASGEEFTISRLRRKAASNYQTVRRWVQRNHPELLEGVRDKGFEGARRRVALLFPDHADDFEEFYNLMRRESPGVAAKEVEAMFALKMQEEGVSPASEVIRPQLLGIYQRHRKILQKELKGDVSERRVLRRYDVFFEQFVGAGDRQAVSKAKREAVSYLESLRAKETKPE